MVPRYLFLSTVTFRIIISDHQIAIVWTISIFDILDLIIWNDDSLWNDSLSKPFTYSIRNHRYGWEIKIMRHHRILYQNSCHYFPFLTITFYYFSLVHRSLYHKTSSLYLILHVFNVRLNVLLQKLWNWPKIVLTIVYITLCMMTTTNNCHK